MFLIVKLEYKVQGKYELILWTEDLGFKDRPATARILQFPYL
jgi:hypothetical protein